MKYLQVHALKNSVFFFTWCLVSSAVQENTVTSLSFCPYMSSCKRSLHRDEDICSFVKWDVHKTAQWCRGYLCHTRTWVCVEFHIFLLRSSGFPLETPVFSHLPKNMLISEVSTLNYPWCPAIHWGSIRGLLIWCSRTRIRMNDCTLLWSN